MVINGTCGMHENVSHDSDSERFQQGTHNNHQKGPFLQTFCWRSWRKTNFYSKIYKELVTSQISLTHCLYHISLVARLVWLGKDVALGGGSLRTAGNAWEALLAH